MIAGTVISTDLDWWGDTLTTATDADDTVLHVDTTVDFDGAGGWLIVGDSAPRAYTAVDDDAGTVTVSSAPGAFEAGTPVYLYDPATAAQEKKALRHVAKAQLHDGRGVITATIPHTAVPVAGIDALVGASVRLEPTDEEEDQWEVAGVLGREPLVDQDSIASTVFSAYGGFATTFDATWTPVVDLWVEQASHPDVSHDGENFSVARPGAYLVQATVRFSAAADGLRQARLMFAGPGEAGYGHVFAEVQYSHTAGGQAQIQVSGTAFAAGPGIISLWIRQTSTAPEVFTINDNPEDTHIEIIRVG